MDPRFLPGLLQDPVLVERIQGEPAVAEALGELLTGPRVAERALPDERLLDLHRRRRTLLERIAADRALFDRLLRLPAALERLGGEPELLERILRLPGVADRVGGDPSLAVRFLSNGRIFERLLADDALLTRVASQPRVLEKTVSDETLLGRIVSHQRVFDRLVSDSQLTDRFLASPRVLERVVSEDRFLTPILDHPRVFAKLLNDDVLLTRLLSKPRVFEKLLSDRELSDRFIYHDRVISRILSEDRLLTPILSDARALARILNDDILLTRLVSKQRVFDKLLTDGVLLGRLVGSERAIEAIAEREHDLRKVLKKPAARRTMLRDRDCRRAFAADRDALGAILSDEALGVDEALRAKLEALSRFEEALKRLESFTPLEEPEIRKRVAPARSGLRRADDVPDAVMDVVCEGNELVLRTGRLRFPDRRSLWILLNEILMDEEYYFEPSSEAPRIVDCGTHCGLGVLYFKTLFPRARILGFEPVPRLHELATQNVRRNHLADVEILPYALWDEEGKGTFYVSPRDSMAGSLTTRRRVAGDDTSEIEARLCRLSDYLDEPVHLLKLDVEGAEDRVLAEIAPQLSKVQYLCCEYHHGDGLSATRLPRILTLLEEAGFDVHVGRSQGFRESMGRRAMRFLDRSYSAMIWARNREWPETAVHVPTHRAPAAASAEAASSEPSAAPGDEAPSSALEETEPPGPEETREERPHHPVFSAFDRFEGRADGRFHYDFLGVRTDPAWWEGMSAPRPGPIRVGYPQPGEQYYEWIFMLETVLACRNAERLTVIELGAGFGPWLVRAHHAFRRFSRSPVRLIGVEGDEDHYRWMRRHLENNGLDPDEHTLIHACASDHEGVVPFLDSEDPSTFYGQREPEDRDVLPQGEAGQVVYGVDGRAYRCVASITLESLLRDVERADLVHMDIQGAEYRVVSTAIEAVQAKVARLLVGTHGTEIEADFRKLLGDRGWKRVYDFPRGTMLESEHGTIHFRDGCQAWVNPELVSSEAEGLRGGSGAREA